MHKPFPAYKGTDPFVFVCYAHSDSEDVYADLVRLNEDGIKLWYDEGIPAGSSWRGEIASAIKAAKKFLFFISEASLNSSHCLREVDYALHNEVEILPVYLEEISLPPELDLVLNRVQALHKGKDARYMEHLQQSIAGGAGIRNIVRNADKPRSIFTAVTLAAGMVVVLALLWMNSGEESSSILSTQPGSFELYLDGMERMERWDKEGNIQEAIEFYRQSLVLDPDFALGYARLAEAQRLQYIITRSTQMLDEAETNAKIALRLNPNLAPVQVIAGRLQQARGNYDLAFAALERALAIDPNDAMANQAIASLYNSLDRFNDAMASYRKALALDPQNLIILDAYANLLYNNNRVAEAVEQWRKVISLAPDHFSSTLNLGTALDEIGNTSDALVMYERAREIRPSHYLAYANIGQVYSMASRFEEAIAEYKKSLELNDADWQVWGNLAFTLSWIEGMKTEAENAFQTAISLALGDIQRDIRDLPAHVFLALFYAKTGEEKLALERLDNALALADDSPDVLAKGAEVYEILGRREQAVEMAEQAVAQGFRKQLFQQNHELRNLVAESDFL